MLSQQMAWQTTHHLIAMTAAWFHTDDYESRLFLYGRQMAHQFAFPSYYGHGIRLMVMARADLLQRLRLSLRMGHTRYFDRSTIGTALQQVDGSSLTDLDLQLRYRL
jgi:hypothetical protein